MWYATTNESFTTKEEFYADAQEKTAVELAKWPYKWVTDEDYAATTRGSLKGTVEVTGTNDIVKIDTTVDNDLTVTDPQKGKSIGWAVLSDMRSEYWALDNDYYIFYAPIWSDGSFEIEDIIPGTYKLDININGIMGEYHAEDIVIGESEAKDLETITWEVPVYGETLWQIGLADRTAQEYAYASPNYRYWGSHLLFDKLFPEGVDFKIGESDESKDWFYVHPASQTIGDRPHYNNGFYYDETTHKVKYDAARADVSKIDENWKGNQKAEYKIRFDSDAAYKNGTATLLIAVSGNRSGSITATLNGTNIIDVKNGVSINGGQMDGYGDSLFAGLRNQYMYSDLVPDENAVVTLYSDGSVMRSGIVGVNQLVEITFDASLIQESENVLTLSHILPSHTGETDEDGMPLCTFTRIP